MAVLDELAYQHTMHHIVTLARKCVDGEYFGAIGCGRLRPKHCQCQQSVQHFCMLKENSNSRVSTQRTGIISFAHKRTYRFREILHNIIVFLLVTARGPL